MAAIEATTTEDLKASMANKVKKFREWISKQRNFLFARYTKDAKETQEPERSLISLPAPIRKKLVGLIEELPSNPADKEAIASVIEESFKIWREDPYNADNSLVVLSSPVTAVSRILSETLEEWAAEKQLPLKLLSLTARPYAVETIKSKLEHELKSKVDNDEDEPFEIVVIPNLSWCFLRCFEGLEGIEYLQSLLCDGSKNRFWIIGAGQVGWQYLNSVCNIEAYCGEVFPLPEIADEDLEKWLNPIVEKLNITFDKPRIDKQLLDADKDNQTNYFECLASVSAGVSTVAIQLFLKSIYYQEPEEDEEISEGVLVAQIPKLPKLPDLEPADRYLLYSLLLHGDLTINGLAQSLGDEKSQVQARVQLLRREGAIEQQNKVIKINSVYYPRVKRELASNNFIINRE